MLCRFEYPPAPTPKKKRLSTPGKGETVKVRVLPERRVKVSWHNAVYVQESFFYFYLARNLSKNIFD